MPGGWIKIDNSTIDKPEILRMSRLLAIDRDAAFGKLVRVWIWFDHNSVDGRVDGAVDGDVDSLVSLNGFAGAMREVRWLADAEEGTGLLLPHFQRHNGETAKQRILKTDRQRRWRRNGDANVDAPVDSKASTKPSLDKIREDKIRKKKIPSAARQDDPLFLSFSKAFEGKYQIPYQHKPGDFVQLAELEKQIKPSADQWVKAEKNYFASDLGQHTLADLCSRFAGFHDHAIDRYNKPLANGKSKPAKSYIYDDKNFD